MTRDDPTPSSDPHVAGKVPLAYARGVLPGARREQGWWWWIIPLVVFMLGVVMALLGLLTLLRSR